jgi:hypothetical protein
MSIGVRRACQCLSRGPYLDQWPNVLVLNATLATDFVKPTSIRTVTHRLILQVAFTALVANRAVERMVGQEELHHTFAGFVDKRRAGLDHHSGLDRPCARRNWLGCPFNFYQTHTAISGNHELLMVTVSWNCNPRLFARLDEGRSGYVMLDVGWCDEVEPCRPSIDTFFPSTEKLETVQSKGLPLHTYCELHLGGPPGARTEGPRGIEGRGPCQSPTCPQKLLSQHLGPPEATRCEQWTRIVVLFAAVKSNVNEACRLLSR